MCAPRPLRLRPKPRTARRSGEARLPRQSAREVTPGFVPKDPVKFRGVSGIVRVYRVHGSQPVAGFRYAHVEGMPPQPAVRLHQDLVRSAPVGGTPGFVTPLLALPRFCYPTSSVAVRFVPFKRCL